MKRKLARPDLLESYGDRRPREMVPLLRRDQEVGGLPDELKVEITDTFRVGSKLEVPN